MTLCCRCSATGDHKAFHSELGNTVLRFYMFQVWSALKTTGFLRYKDLKDLNEKNGRDTRIQRRASSIPLEMTPKWARPRSTTTGYQDQEMIVSHSSCAKRARTSAGRSSTVPLDTSVCSVKTIMAKHQTAKTNHAYFTFTFSLGTTIALTMPAACMMRLQPMTRMVVGFSAPPIIHSSNSINGVVVIQSMYLTIGTVLPLITTSL